MAVNHLFPFLSPVLTQSLVAIHVGLPRKHAMLSLLPRLISVHFAWKLLLLNNQHFPFFENASFIHWGLHTIKGRKEKKKEEGGKEHYRFLMSQPGYYRFFYFFLSFFSSGSCCAFLDEKTTSYHLFTLSELPRANREEGN